METVVWDGTALQPQDTVWKDSCLSQIKDRILASPGLAAGTAVCFLMPCTGDELKDKAGRECDHIKAMVDLTQQILHLLPTCKQMPVGTQQPWPRSFQHSPCLYAHAECCFGMQQCHTQQLCSLHLLLMLSLTVVPPGPPVTTALCIWLSPCHARPSTHPTSLETG